MAGTIYTLDEANRALPLVRAITRDAVRAYRDAKKAIRALELLKSRQQKDLEPEMHRLEEEAERHLADLGRLVEELDGLGCRLRDYERGVVDFPAAGLGVQGFTLYCWALGEPRVGHWHAEGEGYQQRRPVVSRIAG